MNLLFTKGRFVLLVFVIILTAAGIYLFSYAKNNKTEFAATSLDILQKVSKLLPLEPDTKKELEVANALIQELSQEDNRVRVFLVLLQNNHELRPGGGFLGQYAVVKIKNAEIISTVVEDANILDQRIKDANIKVTPPWPLQRYAQAKRWLLHDSNFSPDFPFNVSKAEYFYRLGGGREKFDGVIAVNADVFNHALELTGPITVPVETFTYANGAFAKSTETKTFTSENGTLLLEEAVEKKFLVNEDIDIPAPFKQNRKNVMKLIAAEMVKRLNHIDNIPKIAQFAQNELRTKDIMLYFHDEQLQSLVESVHWDGGVAEDWTGDYLMVVDANVGALKSDYYVKRTLHYLIDFTAEKPKATVTYTYNHTATKGDWRTSDYHSYTRVLAPLGAKYIEQSRKNTGGVVSQDVNELKKTAFGYKVDALIGRSLETSIQYELPETITVENYRLLIQKQSGAGTIPVTVVIKTNEKEYTQSLELQKDINLSIQTVEEKVR
ncbi:MAG: DUF4012 domain-containing protein [Candidatus Moranbacteria bacterium]|nr:DUF4012 domain-containing protein [Candidatus Moranbacteria bacterium]